jgi:hypothetical protein
LARTGPAEARVAAQGFVDHLNGILNRTVTDSRLSLLPLPYDEGAFEVTRLVGHEALPLELLGRQRWLFVAQTIVVVNDHCQTESYSYRLQEDETPASWLLRWEYFRSPPRPNYAYPLAHVHVNAPLAGVDGAERLHLPTRRVPLELIIWHLIAEWEVMSRTDDWQAILRESVAGFDRRRTAH